MQMIHLFKSNDEEYKCKNDCAPPKLPGTLELPSAQQMDPIRKCLVFPTFLFSFLNGQKSEKCSLKTTFFGQKAPFVCHFLTEKGGTPSPLNGQSVTKKLTERGNLSKILFQSFLTWLLLWRASRCCSLSLFVLVCFYLCIGRRGKISGGKMHFNSPSCAITAPHAPTMIKCCRCLSFTASELSRCRPQFGPFQCSRIFAVWK